MLDRARAEFQRRHGRDIRAPAELWSGPLRVLARAAARASRRSPDSAGCSMPRAARSSRRSTGAATGCTRIRSTRRSGAAAREARADATGARGARGGRSVSRAEIVRVDAVTKDVRPGFGLRRKRVLARHQRSCVREGEIFGFVGPNGAGKTTMLKVLLGLIRATSGSRARARPRRRRDGVPPPRRVPAREPLLLRLSSPARETLDFYAKLCGLSREPPARARRGAARPGRASRTPANARIRTYSEGDAPEDRDRAGHPA